tara:strand:+ start:1098 stop:2606 length:1509 start_codon:yes stop_codon:yes gene_type:complete
MTTKNLIAGFFFIYGLLIPLLAAGFVAENKSAATAMVGCCIIIALTFILNRAFLINIILSFYVFHAYLVRPYVLVFKDELSTKHLTYIENVNSYFNPQAAAVVYWSLFSLLLSWLLGLWVFKFGQKRNISYIPNLFKQLDRVVLSGGLPFFFSWGILFFLNYTDPSSGLRGIQTGEGKTIFLWGLASLATINFVCLYAFMKRYHMRLKPKRYFLLIPPSISALSSTLAGSRGALFLVGVMILVYWLGLNINKKWTMRDLLIPLSSVLILLPIVLAFALFAQTLRPLFRYTDSVNISMILDALNFESVLLVKDNLLYGITELLHRISVLKAQFYILNDWHIHDPWQNYNPIKSIMRSINDIVPGDFFPGMLTINQLFNYIYYDSYIHYSSEMWGIQGTLYIYFGHILSPIVIFIIGIFTNRIYPSLLKALTDSPSFAAFFILLLLDIFTNGTFERIFVVDIFRPLSSFIIFLVFYKVFSSFLPTRIRLFKRSRVSYHLKNTFH